MRILILCFFLFPCIYSNSQSKNDLPRIGLEEAGFNKDSIDHLISRIYDTPNGDFRGLVVIKDGKVAIEAYFNTFWEKTVLDIRSAGKSVTALLLGVAIKEGLIESLDQNIYSLFSKSKNPKINEDYKKITLRHVLDMSSGLDADTDDSQSAGFVGHWIGLDDWKSFLLNVPMNAEPGEKFVYADIHPLLIGLAIEEASGMSLKDYAKEKLFDPMGFEPVYWYTNSANQTGAAGNLYLTTPDFAKLGLLILNEGKWNNRQLIESSYIKEIIARKAFELPEFPLADSYGMMWYKSSRTFNGKDFNYLFASGNGGNQLIVIPDQKMVIALTSGAYGQPYGHGRSNAIMRIILESIE